MVIVLILHLLDTSKYIQHERTIMKVTIKDVMSSVPDILSLNSTIGQAASIMQDNEYRVIPIHDENKLVGVVTDRDLAIRGFADGLTSKHSLSSIMTDEVLYCFEGDDVIDVLSNMHENMVQRLIVLNNKGEKNLIGMVSLADIADQYNDPQSMQAVTECCRHY